MSVRELGTLSGPQQRRADSLRRLFDLLHWGMPSRRIYEVQDPLVPDAVQMGAHEALRVLFDGNEVEVPYTGHLGVQYDLGALDRGLPVERLFDDDRIQRLHLIGPLNPLVSNTREFARHKSALADLNVLARRVGGRQARFPYPRVLAYPLAEVTHIVYATDKKGDGFSHYIHAFSEESKGPRPWLAIDLDGRSWLVGGSYTVPPEGITD